MSHYSGLDLIWKHSLIDSDYTMFPECLIDQLVALVVLDELPPNLILRPLLEYVTVQSLKVKQCLYPHLLKAALTIQTGHDDYNPLEYWLELELDTDVDIGIELILTLAPNKHDIFELLSLNIIAQCHVPLLIRHRYDLIISPDMLILAMNADYTNHNEIKVLLDHMMSEFNRNRAVKDNKHTTYSLMLSLLLEALYKHMPQLYDYIIAHITQLDYLVQGDARVARDIVNALRITL